MSSNYYGHSGCKEFCWEHSKPIPGKDPNLFRKDPYGNQIYKGAYGMHGPQSWQIDHIIPQARGGSDAPRNLQALQSSINQSKGKSLVKKSRHS